MAGGARKQIIEKQGSRHQALTLAFLLLTLQPHHDSKAAFEIIGVRVMSIWWRRRGSNSRPYGCEPYALPAELRPHYIKYLTPAGAKLQVYF